MDYKIYNDYELVYMVKEKDDGSQSVLYNKYFPIIKKLASDAYRRYGCYGHDYDDFLQEAYIGFQNAIIRFDEGKNILFYTFAVMCIKRHLLSFCRNISNDTKNIADFNFEELNDALLDDPKSNIEKSTITTDAYRLIKDLIFSLPLEQGCILELKINGFTYVEIGELLNMPSSTIEYKNRKSKKMLLEILKKYMID